MKRLGILVVLACVVGPSVLRPSGARLMPGGRSPRHAHRFLSHIFFPSMTFRYRLVLEATDGAKQVIGETVLSVTFTKNIPLLGGSSNVISQVKGEAMTLALSGGRMLVMLLARGGKGRSDPEDIVPELFKLQTWNLLSKTFVRTPPIAGSHPLPPELLPAIAILGDTQTPTSARYVPVLQFPAQAASDVSITGARIDIINDGIWPLTIFGVTGTQPTKGIELALPWFGSQSARSSFFQSMKSSGHRVGGSMEVMQIFKRG